MFDGGARSLTGIISAGAIKRARGIYHMHIRSADAAAHGESGARDLGFEQGRLGAVQPQRRLLAGRKSRVDGKEARALSMAAQIRIRTVANPGDDHFSSAIASRMRTSSFS
jgi:hypothetical protein